jgi:hypothetical protein
MVNNMLLEVLSLLVGYYVFCVAGYYTYAVVKSHEILGFWTFKIQNGVVGVCKIPKFFTFFLGKKARG